MEWGSSLVYVECCIGILSKLCDSHWMRTKRCKLYARAVCVLLSAPTQLCTIAQCKDIQQIFIFVHRRRKTQHKLKLTAHLVGANFAMLPNVSNEIYRIGMWVSYETGCNGRNWRYFESNFNWQIIKYAVLKSHCQMPKLESRMKTICLWIIYSWFDQIYRPEWILWFIIGFTCAKMQWCHFKETAFSHFIFNLYRCNVNQSSQCISTIIHYGSYQYADSFIHQSIVACN